MMGATYMANRAKRTVERSAERHLPIEDKSDADLSIESIRMLIAIEVRRAVVDELRKFLAAPVTEQPQRVRQKPAKSQTKHVAKSAPVTIATDPYMRRFQLAAYRLRNRGRSWWEIGEAVGAGSSKMTPDTHALELAKFCNGPFDKAYTSRIEEFERRANATK